MKNHLAIVSLVLLTLVSATGFAQSNRLIKTPLFTNFPKAVNCTPAQLENFFTVTSGQKINASFENTLKFNGVVTNNVAKYNNKLQSVSVKMPEFKDAIFSISKRMDENNQPVYVGRIIQANSSDAYVLKRVNKNSYQFVKINLEEILTDCTMQ